MRIYKTPGGDFYLCKSAGRTGARNKSPKPSYLVFRAHAYNQSGQMINLNHAYVPRELWGKKFRFKVEVIDERTHTEETTNVD